MKILVTGGAGYIGSHIAVELLQLGHSVVIIDDFRNSSREVIHRIEQITSKKPILHEFDLCDRDSVDEVLKQESVDAVIHCAGLKAVGESTEKPLLYYRNNIDASLSLLESMQKHHVNKLIFSSSATVYGTAPIPYSENSQVGVGITNPYGQTKYMIEQIISDYAAANPESTCCILRYFNPIGAHESGLIGEDPDGIPNNLMPFIAQVATGKRQRLKVFGNDYDTVDGTGVRDYIHVVDLAKGHVAALRHASSGLSAYNLGSGKGTSVLELLHAFENASGKTIPFDIVERRPGDLPEYYATAQKAFDELGWETTKTIDDMCRDTWNWQSQNPEGYS